MRKNPNMSSVSPFSGNFSAEILNQTKVLKTTLTRHMPWIGKISGALVEQSVFAGTNFAIDIILARFMSADAYGAYVVTDAWFLLCQNLYDAYLTEPMAIFGSGKYGSSFKKYMAYTYIGHLGVSIILALILGIAAFLTGIFDSHFVASAMLGAAIATPLLLTRWLARQPFYILGKPHWSAIGNVLFFAIAMVGIFVLNHLQILTPFSIFIMLGLASLCYSASLTIFLLKPDFKLQDKFLSARQITRDHLHYGKWSSGAKIASWIPSNVYYVVLPTLVGLSATAALRGMNYLIMPLSMAVSAAMGILLPIFSRTYASSGKGALSRQVRAVLMIFLAISTGYCFVVTVFGTKIVSLLFSGRFDSFVTVPILLTMGLVPIVVSVNVVIDAALRSMGNVKQSFLSTLIPAALILTVGIGLLSKFGLLGANLGTLVISMVATSTLVRFYRRAGTATAATAAHEADAEAKAKGGELNIAAAKRFVQERLSLNANALRPLSWSLSVKYGVAISFCLIIFAVPAYLLVRSDVYDLNVGSTESLLIQIGIAIIVLLVALLVALILVIRQLTVPSLNRLRQSIQAIADGNDALEILDTERGDEIGLLAVSLVGIQKRLRTLTEDRDRDPKDNPPDTMDRGEPAEKKSVAALVSVAQAIERIPTPTLSVEVADKASETPLVSVVMPAYNTEKYIAQAIESILNQTFQQFEFIIVDDGSTDRTLKIAEAYAKLDARIRILHAHHSGVAGALNQGLNAASCSWVAIMHADDIALPTRLAVQWEAAQSDPEVVIWGTDGFHISEQGRCLNRFRVGPTSKEECREQRASGKIVQAIHPTVMLNREVALRVGGYETKLDACEDIELFDRMMNHGALVTLPEQLMQYRVHGSKLSMKKYLSQSMVTRYVSTRQRQRIDTGTELTYDAFLVVYENNAASVRLGNRLSDISGISYRRAGLAFSNQQYAQLFVYFGITLLLSPLSALRRGWTQTLSPETRHTTLRT